MRCTLLINLISDLWAAWISCLAFQQGSRLVLLLPEMIAGHLCACGKALIWVCMLRVCRGGLWGGRCTSSQLEEAPLANEPRQGIAHTGMLSSSSSSSSSDNTSVAAQQSLHGTLQLPYAAHFALYFLLPLLPLSPSLSLPLCSC